MIMVTNHGHQAHRVAAQLPLRGLSAADSTAAAAVASSEDATGFAITVEPGHETDVSFTATAAGRYAYEVDDQPGGDLDVLA